MIGKRWTGAIVCALLDGPLRFAELTEAVPGMSDRLLSQRLKELESRELVSRAVHGGTPIRVEYSLTPKGEGLGPAIDEMRAWAQRWESAEDGA